MRSDTQKRIFEFIKGSYGVTAQEIIKHLGYHPTGVFKHLKIMREHGLIYKVGKPPKVRYYVYAVHMANVSKTITEAMNWAVSGKTRLAAPEILCQTRDIFQARTVRLVDDLKKVIPNDNLVYLLVAAAGEIGNNSFDHNIGQWQDVPGVFFYVDTAKRQIILADRGQGVLATIKKVRPQVLDDADAIKIAFTERVSGRAPEKRGNGLKFVKKVIEEYKLNLKFYSGQAAAEIMKTGLTVKKVDIKIPGTFAYITF